MASTHGLIRIVQDSKLNRAERTAAIAAAPLGREALSKGLIETGQRVKVLAKRMRYRRHGFALYGKLRMPSRYGAIKVWWRS